MAKGNCRNCGRPIWNDGDYCSRPCEDEDTPARLGEILGTCLGTVLGCGILLGFLVLGFFLLLLLV